MAEVGVGVGMNRIRIAAGLLPGRWHQGDLGDGQGNRCGLGWLVYAFRMTGDWVLGTESVGLAEQREFMDQAAEDKFPERTRRYGGPSFASFNDHPDTTETEVLSVMELAAERWEVEHGRR